MSSINLIDGFPFPSFFDESNYFLLKNLKLRPGDVVVSTYPKCGTTWVCYILWGILNPEEDPPEGSRVQERDIPFVDTVGWGRWKETPNDQPRVFATHFPSRSLPYDKSSKFIAVARNPLDCCVSFYNFAQSLKFVNPSEDGLVSNDFFEDFLKGDMIYGDFFDHIRGWYERREENNVHFMTYEELSKDPTHEVLKLGRFLGLHHKLEENGGKLLDKIVKQSSFDFMKKNVKYCLGNKTERPRELPMIRKGIVGSFKDELSEDQIRRLKEKMETSLQGTVILDLWKSL